MRRIDAVIFDAGETLLHPDPSFSELLAHLIGERGHTVERGRIVEAEAASARHLTEMFARTKDWSLSRESSRAFWTELYAGLARELGIEDEGLPDFLYDEFSKPERYALFDDALDALTALKSEGYKLAVVSNFEAWLEGLLTSLEVLPMLDAIVVSGVEGVEKPDPKIFRLALERLGVAAERACYVGDTVAFDVEPARAIGMTAYLIDRRGRHDPDVLPVISSLRELPEKLR